MLLAQWTKTRDSFLRLFSFGTCLVLRNAIGTLSELNQRVIALRTHGEMSDPEFRLTLESTHAEIVN